MERKFKINDELFNQIFPTDSVGQSEELKNKIYSLIEEIPCDNEAKAEEFSESTVNDVFKTKNTLKIINL
ncbi:hypothetical protein [uncultured Prevotellamassilia sp.]|uniref:hypothetical protein n=1 Tax=uncultured Prevotellamassilia sp. TaxID=1926676 RepID=UPI00258B62C2|nr:hypothetical protein [uncultured Prevotellamassilia sp.]